MTMTCDGLPQDSLSSQALCVLRVVLRKIFQFSLNDFSATDILGIDNMNEPILYNAWCNSMPGLAN